jgi:hypothetical protein
MSTGDKDQGEKEEEYVTIEIDPDIAKGFELLYEVQVKTPFEDKARRKILWSKISECIERYEKKRRNHDGLDLHYRFNVMDARASHHPSQSLDPQLRH